LVGLLEDGVLNNCFAVSNRSLTGMDFVNTSLRIGEKTNCTQYYPGQNTQGPSGWDSEIWDFSECDFALEKFPQLKNVATNPM